MQTPMKPWLGLLALAAGVAPLAPTAARAADVKGPSSSQTPYLVSLAPGVSTTSLLTVGDSVNLKPDGSTPYRMVGIPDGLGAFDNGDDTFSVLMNHELGETVGVVRAHGAKGAFVSKYIIRKGDLSVVRGGDLIQQTVAFDSLTSTYKPPAKGVAFRRFCSADLPPVSAFFANGAGFNGRLFMNGEETGNEGKGYAITLDGTAYELPRLGKFSWENSLANPAPREKTIVIGTDDTTPGQVYVYVGTKTNAGSPVDRAGLTNGNLFGVKVEGVPLEPRTNGIANGTRFSLHPFGNVETMTGAQLQTASVAAGVTEFLRPEDGHWDTKDSSVFYFVTTDRFDSIKNPGTPPGQVGRSRLYRLRFSDINNPSAGGTIEMLLDGTEPHQMLDNMTADSFGQILMQEDPGGQDYLAKIQLYDIGADTETTIAQHDPARFTPGAPGFLTRDEESSGIIDVSDILGRGTYLVDVQAHYNIGDAELVEGGQLLVIKIAPPNEAPDGIDDTYSVDEDSTLTTTTSNGVLANDEDADDNTLTATLVSGPSNGTLTLNADGTFIYKPNADFVGVDSFTYRARDAALQGEVTTVTIQVLPVNDAPTAMSDVALSYNGAIIEIDVLANDRDSDGGALKVTSVDDGEFGETELLADGKIRYTPEANFGGEDEFIYTLSDGKGGTSIGRVTVTVADFVAPALAFTSPLDRTIIRQLAPVAGTVADSENTNVTLLIQRGADRKYFSGRNYSSTPVYLPTVKTADGWVLPAEFTPASANLVDGKYLLTAFARDRSGNTSTAQVFVHVDRNGPTLEARTFNPRPGMVLSALSSISGRVTDSVGGTGMDRVVVFLRRASDGKYFNGTAYVLQAVSLRAQLRGSTFVVSEGLPSGEDQTNGLYYITVAAYDRAGNRTVVQSTFRLVGANPVVR